MVFTYKVKVNDVPMYLESITQDQYDNWLDTMANLGMKVELLKTWIAP
jgi:hypothetical protein